MAHIKKGCSHQFNKKAKHANRKPSPNTGKVAAKPTEGASMSRKIKRSFLQKDIKYLPVILERNEKAVGNIVMKKYGKE